MKNEQPDDCRHIFGNMADWPRPCMTCGKDESTIQGEKLAALFQQNPPDDCRAAEPTTDLPLKGYYGGKPKRFTIEFDDLSTTCIGNADGSVDLIAEKLERLYAANTPLPDAEALVGKLHAAKRQEYGDLIRFHVNYGIDRAITVVRQHFAEHMGEEMPGGAVKAGMQTTSHNGESMACEEIDRTGAGKPAGER